VALAMTLPRIRFNPANRMCRRATQRTITCVKEHPIVKSELIIVMEVDDPRSLVL
jgi:hypothetical protein